MFSNGKSAPLCSEDEDSANDHNKTLIPLNVDSSSIKQEQNPSQNEAHCIRVNVPASSLDLDSEPEHSHAEAPGQGFFHKFSDGRRKQKNKDKKERRQGESKRETTRRDAEKNSSDGDTVIQMMEKPALFEGHIFKDWSLLNRHLRAIGSFPFVERNDGGKNCLDISNITELTTIKKEEKQSESGGENTSIPEVKEIEFKWLSWISLYSLVVDLARIFLFFRVFENWGVRLLGREFENRVEDWIVKALNITMPLSRIWSILCLWYSAPRSVLLLNRWQLFEHFFLQIFPRVPYQSQLKTWRRVLIVTAGLPTIIVSISVFANLSGMNWDVALRCFGHIFFIYSITLEEARVLVHFRTATEAFRNFHLGIRSIIGENYRFYDDHCKAVKESRGNGKHKDFSSTTSIITTKTTREWNKMIRLIRKQVEMTGVIHSPQQIVMLGHNLMFHTESLFILLVSIISGSSTNSNKWLYTILSMGHVARLVFKVIFAEQITQEERKIEEELSEIDPQTLDMSARFELKKLADVIRQNPCKMQLAGGVTLEKRLLIKFTGYVLAYMVILFQFQLATNYSPRNNSISTTHDESFNRNAHTYLV